jgi:hypothetical protein
MKLKRLMNLFQILIGKCERKAAIGICPYCHDKIYGPDFSTHAKFECKVENNMSIKRCEHFISINLELLKRVLSSPSDLSITNAVTHIVFKNGMSEEEKKELANWIITQSVKTVRNAAEGNVQNVKKV